MSEQSREANQEIANYWRDKAARDQEHMRKLRNSALFPEVLDDDIEIEWGAIGNGTTITENFSDVCDACCTTAIAVDEAHEDPLVELRLGLAYGMIDMTVLDLGDDGKVLAIGARQRSDGEIRLLAQGLRWLADRISDPDLWKQVGYSGVWEPVPPQPESTEGEIESLDSD